MKNVILAMFLVFPTSALAHEEGETNYGVRAEYDGMIKDSGKWGFISNFLYLNAALWAGGSYYASTRADKYSVMAKQAPLSEHDLAQQQMWQQVSHGAGYGAAGFLVFGLIGTGMSLQYESRAHEFALDMHIKF